MYQSDALMEFIQKTLHSHFALGIVTGSNSDYISSEKSNTKETVLKGSDIFKFRFVGGRNFIRFDPDNF